MIRVVVIDDSPVVCRAIGAFLRADPRIGEVVSTSDPPAAAGVVAAARPDVVTLDLEMPPPGGLAVLAGIMAVAPTPVVVVTGVSRAAAAATLRAVDLGAVDFLLKYTPGRDTRADEFRRDLVAKAVAAAARRAADPPAPGRGQESGAASPGGGRHDPSAPARVVVVIGASTGGQPALRALFAALPPGFPAAILVAQHLPGGFTQALAAQLAPVAPGPVREAVAGDVLAPGVVLIAPGGCHTTVRPDGRLGVAPAGNELSPSVDQAIASAAQVFGARLHAVVLSGMGADGVVGFSSARAVGAATYAQDPRTCVIPGMPERVIERGVVDRVGGPADLGRLLGRVVMGGPVPCGTGV